MERAICYECFDDAYLKEIARVEGETLVCSICQSNTRNALTVEVLGALMDPIIREHFLHGKELKMFGEDDSEWWEQGGEPLSWVVQEVLGQHFDFEDEIIDAIVEAEDVRPQDGEESFYELGTNYVERRVSVSHLYAEWDFLLEELKQRRRFFSPSARALFGRLFDGVETMKFWERDSKSHQSVARVLPEGTEIFRARICNSHAMLTEAFREPFTHIGPPPPDRARAGRMNADGVVVFYAAMEEDTCLAELRPAIGNDLIVITVKTTKPLRILDFRRLEMARAGKALSYFQPDFNAEVEKREFLRRLHRLIAQPVVPGKEADYLITQTMAEYLAHVHPEPFDGVLFASAQRADGTNVVIFADTSVLGSTSDVFGMSYVKDSAKLFSTVSIDYKHRSREVSFFDERAWIHNEPEDDLEDD